MSNNNRAFESSSSSEAGSIIVSGHCLLSLQLLKLHHDFCKDFDNKLMIVLYLIFDDFTDFHKYIFAVFPPPFD